METVLPNRPGNEALSVAVWPRLRVGDCAWKVSFIESAWPTAVFTRGERLELAKVHHRSPSTRWDSIMGPVSNAVHREPSNKGKIVGQQVPFKLKDIWALRVRL